MWNNLRSSVLIGITVLGLNVIGSGMAASAQQPVRTAPGDAPLVVDGVVRQVFRSARPGRTDFLVEIEVQRSEAKRLPAGTSRIDYPGPGESVYVHVFQRTDAAGQTVRGDGYTSIPEDGAQVRAYLAPRQPAGWDGVFPDWYESTSNVSATTGTANTGPMVESPLDQPATALLKMTVEAVRIKDQLALRVTSVERRGPAQQAGLEPGDVIVGVNGAPLANLNQLDELAKRGAPFSLVVADVHTGRAAQVQVTPAAATGTSAAAAPASPPVSTSRVSLGVSAESVSLGTRTALKVTRVEPGSPAEKAGLEPGDVIVEADGAPVTGPEQLVGAVRKSGPTLELTVRDSRTGRDTPVKVAMGGAQPPSSLPTGPATPPTGTGAAQLGVVTEMAFHNDEFAVKVTEVEAGSASARAGLRPGVLILEVNGQPVLHPDDLTDAVRQAGRNVQLTVADPASGRKETINIAL